MLNLSRPEAPVSASYAARVAAGLIERDPVQETIVRMLAALETELAGQRDNTPPSLRWLLGTRARDPIRGFFAVSRIRRKRRAHFHEFMAEVHERIHALRQEIKAGVIQGCGPRPPRRRGDSARDAADLL